MSPRSERPKVCMHGGCNPGSPSDPLVVARGSRFIAHEPRSPPPYVPTTALEEELETNREEVPELMLPPEVSKRIRMASEESTRSHASSHEGATGS